jgi:hypothetical protein
MWRLGFKAYQKVEDTHSVTVYPTGRPIKVPVSQLDTRGQQLPARTRSHRRLAAPSCERTTVLVCPTGHPARAVALGVTSGSTTFSRSIPAERDPSHKFRVQSEVSPMTAHPDALAAVVAIKKHTGVAIRLPLGHAVQSYEVTDTRLVLVISTARVTSTRHGLKVTHRGLHVREWARPTSRDPWSARPAIVTEWRLDEPEVFGVSSTRSAADQRESQAWAAMCYRPGSSAYPMDGPNGSNPSVR